MSEEYAHLQPSVRTLVEQSAEVRDRRIRADRWIGYDCAEAALTAMEDLLNFPKRTRMPNLLLVGPTNNGKTMIVEKIPTLPHPDTRENCRGGGCTMFRCSRCRCLRPR